MLRFPRPVEPNSIHGSTVITFWDVTPPLGGYTYAYCIAQRNAVQAAIDQIIAGRVKSYHVGSRGLEKLSLPDLMEYLRFWNNAANDALLGPSSAIQTRRAAPCDV